MPTTIKLAALSLAALALAACSTAEPLTTPPAHSAPASSSKPTHKATPKPSRCLTAPKALVRYIASEAVPGAGFEPVKAAAVRSRDHKSVYMVAVRFKVSGVGGSQVGVWATGG